MRKTPKLTKKALMAKKNTGVKNLTGIPLLTSPAYKRNFHAYAETVSKQKLQFTMTCGAGCFAGMMKDKQIPLMNIDLNMFENDAFDTSHYHIVAKGAILHESGHLLYSDYTVIKENVEYSEKLQKECSELGQKWYRETDEDTKSDLFTELEEKLVEYVYSANMPRTLNALEDGSIEASMCERGKEDSGCICFLRDTLYEKDLVRKKEELNNGFIPMDENEWNDITMESIIIEVCFLATLGYRRATNITVIENLLTDKEVEEVKQLARYARFGAPTTSDRNNTARVILDMCKPILEKIAKDLAQAYIDNINNAEDMLNNMQNNANQFGNNTSGTPGASGTSGQGLPSTTPQPQPKYSLDLPDELKQKIQSQGSGNESEESEGNDSENQSGGSGSDRSEEETEENGGQSLKSEEESEQEAINNMNEVLRNAKKTFQRQEEQSEVDNIINHPNIRAGEGECHQAVNLTICENEDISYMSTSYEGDEALKLIEKKQLLPKVNDLSKKIKKVLMHRSQDEISKGRYEGKIDTAGLYRIRTDLQVFKKEQQGEKTKVRFAILVDESGSMSGSGLTYAITGCWMIAKAAQKLRIPFAIQGHKDIFGVQVEKYVDYKDCSKTKVLENIFKMNSGGCNRDGLAIYHSLRELVSYAKPDEELYFIILSDGQPYSEGYSGQRAIEDIKNVVKTYKKHWNVHTIGIGIGDDFDYEDTVGKIYENSIVVANPEDLPNEMFKVLKKIVKA